MITQKGIVLLFLSFAAVPGFAKDDSSASCTPKSNPSKAFVRFVDLYASLSADRSSCFDKSDLIQKRVSEKPSFAFSMTRVAFLESQDEGKKSGKPPVTTGKFLAEVVVGGLGGYVGSMVVGALVAGVFGPHGGEDPGFYGYLFGFPAGTVIGSSLGVCLVGKSGNVTGSYAITLLGSLLGTGLSILLLPDPDYISFWLGLYGLSALGGTIFFNATRRYEKPPESGGAMINIRDNRMSLAVPRMFFRTSCLDGRTLVKNIDLVRLVF